MPSLMCMPWSCNRQVDSLDRRQCNLQQIPGDLERYARSLEELLLDMNHIRDLPKSLFRLHKLQRLGLSDNDIHRLPPEVSALQNLVELNLSRNDISDLPEDLKICQNLQVLDISSNPIARLPDSITLCTSLTQLSLNDISLTKLPQDIGKLVLLKSLEVRENHLRTLPPSIAELSQLQRLDLGQNELDELPSELGSLRSLQELYVDENSLEKLPDALLRCVRLEQLDASSNRIFQLPDELGELISLIDLTVSHNCLRELPGSIGRLKRLFILKADDNTIDALTPAIGGCTALSELYLQQNLIAEVPNSIGNLRWLQTLNLDRCQLRRLPTQIGECQSLTVLSVRDNQLEELPMEVGKLARLRVLDVCNNRISNLPYTINVLRELQALWISENQSQALLRLQQDTDPKTGIKVLTCYLLPQQSVENNKTANGNGAPPQAANKTAAGSGFVGGPKVHFGHADEEEQEEATTSAGKAAQQQFERKNTPHPKPSVGGASAAAGAAKHHKKQQVDGHVAPRIEEHPKSFVLNSSGKKISQDHSSSQAHSNEPSTSQQHPSMPRSALKYSSRAVIQQQQSQAEPAAQQQQKEKQPTQQQQQQKTVFFANSSGQNAAASGTDSPNECRLKRVNTPHYKSQRAAAGGGQQQQQNRRQLPKTPAANEQQPQQMNSSEQRRPQQQSATQFPSVGHTAGRGSTDGMHVQEADKTSSGFATNNQLSNNTPNRAESPPAMVERKRVIVRRDKNNGGGGGLGLSIAGGVESTPFVENDPGLFISKLVPNGAAERAGLRVGDKVLEINGTSMLGQRHQAAVDCIHQRADAVELLIQRQRQQQQVQKQHSPLNTSVPLIPSNPTTNPSAPNSIRPTTPSQLTNTSFSSLPATASSNNTPQQQQQSPPKLPYAADLAFGDTQLDGVVEEVDLVRDSKNSLGLSIVGGIDHCSHPFGSSTHPGVFISKIATNSPAEASRRLRIGDRILRVNDTDISASKHNEAVEALKRTGRTIRLTVCHEPQPRALRWVVVHRQDVQPLGLSICGGIGSSPVNPDDRTDEGIFIERVEKGGPAELSCVGLAVGMRILEVNDDSLLGCTKEEAAQIFRRASSGPVRLLICEGFTTAASRPPLASVTVSASSPVPTTSKTQQKQRETMVSPQGVGVGLVTSPPAMNGCQNGHGMNGQNEYQNIGFGTPKSAGSEPQQQQQTPLSTSSIQTPLSTSSSIILGNSTTNSQQKSTGNGANVVEQQAAGSVPLLTRIGSIGRAEVTTFSSESSRAKSNGMNNGGSKIPPPVAPKPKTNITSFPIQSNSNGNGNNVENLTDFSARLRHFEEQQKSCTPQTQTPPIPPSKRPLLSGNDLAKLAEDDRMRQQKQLLTNGDGNVGKGISPMSPPTSVTVDRQSQPSFEHILNDSPIPFSQPLSSVSSIRTKKAENRFLQQQGSTAIDQLATEQQRRSEWRQARMASLEAESQRVGQLINDVNEKLLLSDERQQIQNNVANSISGKDGIHSTD